MISLDKVNNLNKSDFVSLFGNIFEKTEWIAEKEIGRASCRERV